MSIRSRVDSINPKDSWEKISPVVRELASCVIGRYCFFYPDKEELYQEAEIKAHQLIYSPHRDPERSLYGFLFTGMRNQLGNYIKKHKGFAELDEERHADDSVPQSPEFSVDDLATRAAMTKKFLDDKEGAPFGTNEEDSRLFLQIISAKTSVKEARALADTSLSCIALITLFLFSGRTVRFPSDETLERYLRYVGIYRDSMKGVSPDDIARKYDVRKAHLPRIIETVQEIIDGVQE